MHTDLACRVSVAKLWLDDNNVWLLGLVNKLLLLLLFIVFFNINVTYMELQPNHLQPSLTVACMKVEFLFPIGLLVESYILCKDKQISAYSRDIQIINILFQYRTHSQYLP